MSKEFIEKGYNKDLISKASRQERQLSYFTQSELQEDITTEYLKQWAERNYKGNDYFLNFVKQVFKTENFLFFFKYLRKPLPSAKLINNKIKPQLKRVFTSENADFKYDVTNVDKQEIKETLDIKDFQEELFNKMLFKHNSIVIEDLDSEEKNKPFRYFLDIDRVMSLAHDNKNITKIAFTGCAVIDGVEVEGIIYIDNNVYSLYDDKHNLISEVAHDLGRCPANFIIDEKYKGNFIIRESIFTYVREELEEYVFLKTLQRMTEPNGALPVVTKLEVPDDNEDIDGSNGEPNSNNIMGSQKASIYNENNNEQTGDLQAGTMHEVPIEAITKDDGSLDMEAVKSYLNFFYIPVEALNYMKDRINEIENSVISTIVGTIDISNSTAVNELQIEKSIIVLENTLINLADSLNKVRRESDYNMLALKYSPEKVNEVFIFYGTDFFLESQSKLFADLEKAPNPIERKNLLVRINQNKYKNNHDQMVRAKLLYDLVPFTTDADFDKGVANGLDEVTKQYYLRFNYWIGLFEAQYGDIVSFWTELESDTATRLTLVNNLIIDIIKNNTIADDLDDDGGELSENERIKIDAQSKLKGTVGGVDGILSIQEGVKNGTTQYSAALEILNEIFGFTDEKSRAILGKEKTTIQTETNNN